MKNSIHCNTPKSNKSSVIRKNKILYFKQFYNENACNAKNTWSGIKSIININNSPKNNPTSLLIGEETISDPKVIADTFNNYFSTIAQKLQSKIFHPSQDYKKYLKSRNENSFFYINESIGPHSIPTSNIISY